LTAIRPEHVIGRMKLNTQLREVLMFVGRVGDADRVLQETTRLREGITRVTASALYDAGILAADEAESIRVAARESAAVEDGLGQAISVFTPEGSDGRTANERVGNMLGSVQVPTGDGP